MHSGKRLFYNFNPTFLIGQINPTFLIELFLGSLKLGRPKINPTFLIGQINPTFLVGYQKNPGMRSFKFPVN